MLPCGGCADGGDRQDWIRVTDGGRKYALGSIQKKMKGVIGREWNEILHTRAIGAFYAMR
jgi:hypothetical protein